jgi:hypothetical protein
VGLISVVGAGVGETVGARVGGTTAVAAGVGVAGVTTAVGGRVGRGGTVPRTGVGEATSRQPAPVKVKLSRITSAQRAFLVGIGTTSLPCTEV